MTLRCILLLSALLALPVAAAPASVADVDQERVQTQGQAGTDGHEHQSDGSKASAHLVRW